MKLKYNIIYTLVICCALSLWSKDVASQNHQLRLPSIISDHMLLQQDQEVKLWGWANPRNKIKIVAEWSKDTIEAVTTEQAKWEAYIKTPKAGGPYTIQFIGNRNTVVVNDVMIGELWLCSGQSNMEYSVKSGVLDAKEELSTCTNNEIRFFFIDKSTADYPQDDCSGYWKVCDPESMQWFSSVGYFFGKKLNQSLKTPIGLINCNWGGTAAETWTPKDKLSQSEELLEAWKKLKPSTGWDSRIGTTYNAMINPITNMKLAGVIWYQGENNVLNAYTYSHLLTTMIQGWREKFQTNLPFYYVQIAPYRRYPVPFSAALVREQQEKAMDFENVGMVVVSDCVDNISDIHPRYKKSVGDRLANWALAETYKKNVTKYKHTTFKEAVVENNKLRIHFNNCEDGLQIKGKEIEALEIAGEDGKFFPAKAKVDKNTIVAEAKEVKSPKHVRFSFSNDGVGNLFDASGLPVSPFRTDNEVFDLTPPKK